MCEIQKNYQQQETFKQGQMEIADANSGLSWTEMYEVAKATFPKILPFVFIAAVKCSIHFQRMN